MAHDSFGQFVQALEKAGELKRVSRPIATELEITELQCKFKLNQHRPESHAALRRTFATGGEAERELLGWMDRLNM